MSHDEPPLDDLLDRLVSEYADRLSGGAAPDRAAWLRRVPADARPGFERVLKMIEAGLAQPPSAGTALAPGMRLDHYELVHEIGRGGMALVWLAQDRELRRPVALKILRPGLALEARHADRFRREALAIASLKHPHVVQIHGVGQEAGYHFLAMEFVEGPSLATVLEALPADRTPTAEDLARATGITALAADGRDFERALAHLLAPVAEALAVAHERGLVHRDVKPSNILVHRDGRAVVADFGLAKGADEPALSLTGDALGTPFYMSPEQAYVTGNRVDHRTDVYSLGVTLYEALSGRRPFEGDSFLEVIEAIRTTVPPSLRSVRHACSKDAAALVRKAMAREPEQRYATAADMHADLVALAEGRTTRALQDEGGPLRQFWTQFRLYSSGQTFEYVSARRFLGLPLVHVVSGPRYPGQRRRHARGWLAFGDVAVGGLACGQIAAGGVAIGGLSAGLVGWGGLTAGLLCWGGMGVGLIAFCGVAFGWLAIGGAAFGYGAMGGYARGVYAMGGSPHGEHVIGGGRHDAEAEAWFRDVLPWVMRFFGGED